MEMSLVPEKGAHELRMQIKISCKTQSKRKPPIANLSKEGIGSGDFGFMVNSYDNSVKEKDWII